MILADTHVLVWLAERSVRLPVGARDILLDSPFMVSVVTAFEYAELQIRGLLNGAPPFDVLQVGLDFAIAPLPADVWQHVASLPDIHRDPVDRMLIGHALALDATLATDDTKIRQYAVKTLW